MEIANSILLSLAVGCHTPSYESQKKQDEKLEVIPIVPIALDHCVRLNIDLPKGYVKAIDEQRYRDALREQGYVPNLDSLKHAKGLCKGKDYKVYYLSEQRAPRVQSSIYSRNTKSLTGLVVIIDNTQKPIQVNPRSGLPEPSYVLITDRDKDGIVEDVYSVDMHPELGSGHNGCFLLPLEETGSTLYKLGTSPTDPKLEDFLIHQKTYKEEIERLSSSDIVCEGYSQ